MSSRTAQPERVLSARIREAAIGHDEAALALLEGGGTLTPDQVHDVRVAIKNLRALWRLAGTQSKGKTARRHYDALRQAGKTLAESRDSQVMVETLEALAAGSKRDYEIEALARVREVLIAASPVPVTASVTPRLAAVFRDDRVAWEALALNTNDDDLLRTGLGPLYRQVRGRGLEALAEDRPEVWHRFRKWAKYLLYQLEPLAPAEQAISLKELKKLGSALGRLHDLGVLEQRLKAIRKAVKDGEALAHVRQAITRREAALGDECEKRTRHFFSLKPKAFRRALEADLSVRAEPSAPPKTS